MRIVLIFLLAIIVLGTVYFSTATDPWQISLNSDQSHEAEANHPKAGLPDVSFLDLKEDKQVSLYSLLKNTGGYVHFWASWCAPCVVEFPEMLNYARSNPDKIIVTISSDFKRDHITQFFEKNQEWGAVPDNVYLLMDKNSHATTSIFQVFKLPETMIISKDLKIIEKHSGIYEWE